VINLQTNFGGGKTHSMLALWHVAAGLPVGQVPQETQELLTNNGYIVTKVNRVAVVGNHFSPYGTTKDDGTHVNTIWGELAWQLGGSEAYALVAKADADRTTPGAALHDLLAKYSPAVILIDEWVAYARSLVGRDDLAGGTFDDQFTFAQSLTEAAKVTPGVLLVISIPASETGDDSDNIVAGNAEEVGGAHGLEALKRLQNVVRRVAEQWRPASSAGATRLSDNASSSNLTVLHSPPSAPLHGSTSTCTAGTPTTSRANPATPHTKTASSGPIQSIRSCSTGSTKSGPRWSAFSGLVASCG
jgi:hypothetical protein